MYGAALPQRGPARPHVTPALSAAWPPALRLSLACCLACFSLFPPHHGPASRFPTVIKETSCRRPCPPAPQFHYLFSTSLLLIRMKRKELEYKARQVGARRLARLPFAFRLLAARKVEPCRPLLCRLPGGLAQVSPAAAAAAGLQAGSRQAVRREMLRRSADGSFD